MQVKRLARCALTMRLPNQDGGGGKVSSACGCGGSTRHTAANTMLTDSGVNGAKEWKWAFQINLINGIFNGN